MGFIEKYFTPFRGYPKYGTFFYKDVTPSGGLQIFQWANYLGPSSHPGWRAEPSHILVHSPFLAHPPIPLILVHPKNQKRTEKWSLPFFGLFYPQLRLKLLRLRTHHTVQRRLHSPHLKMVRRYGCYFLGCKKEFPDWYLHRLLRQHL